MVIKPPPTNHMCMGDGWGFTSLWLYGSDQGHVISCSLHETITRIERGVVTQALLGNDANKCNSLTFSVEFLVLYIQSISNNTLSPLRPFSMNKNYKLKGSIVCIHTHAYSRSFCTGSFCTMYLAGVLFNCIFWIE